MGYTFEGCVVKESEIFAFMRRPTQSRDCPLRRDIRVIYESVGYI